MTLRRLFLSLGVILLLMVAVVTGVLSQIDHAVLVRRLTDQVETLTDRDFEIHGSAQFDLFGSMLALRPKVVIEEATLSNLPWGQPRPFAYFKRIEATLALWPLLTSGVLVVADSRVYEPRFYLETDGKGTSNWRFPGEPPADREAASGLRLDRVEMQGAVLTYRDGYSGNEYEITVKRGLGRAIKSGKATAVEVQGQYRDYPFSVTGETGPMGDWVWGRLNFPVDIVAKSGVVILEVKGRVPDPLAVSLDMRATMRLTDLFANGEGRLEAKVGGTSTHVRLEEVTAHLGTSHAVGNLEVLSRPAALLVIGRLQADRVDVDELIDAVDGPDLPPRGDGRLLSPNPFNLRVLSWFDANVEIQAKQFRYLGLEARDANLPLRLTNALLDIRPLTGVLAEGKLAVEAILDSGKPVPEFLVKMELDDGEADQILSMLGISEVVSGQSAIHWQVATAGRTPQEAGRNLRGQLDLTLFDGKINSFYLDLLTSDLLGKVAPWPYKEKSKLECIVSRFNFGKARGEVDLVMLDTNDITVVGEGFLDLNTEGLRMRVVPRPKDLALISLARPVLIRGMLSDPEFTPDPEDLLTDVLGAVIVTNTLGPIGLLIPFITTGSGKTNPCADALAYRAGLESKPFDGPQTLSDRVGGLVSGVKDTLGLN